MDLMTKVTAETLFKKWRETINTIIDNINWLGDNKTDIDHAVTSTKYGKSTKTLFGHVKLSDDDTATSTANDGIAPSFTVIQKILSKINDVKKDLTDNVADITSSINNLKDNKSDITHTHTNIISSGVKTILASESSNTQTTNQIPDEGISISEIYNTANTPVTFGNVINIRGKTRTGGGQFACGWNANGTTQDVYYRSHSNTSAPWGKWRRLLFADDPVVDNLTVSGTLGVTGVGTFSDNVNVMGTLSATKVVNAVWNDYAEFFPRGEETEPGDIIALDENADHERYIKATASNSLIVGVHSNTYGHILGGDAGVSEEENLKNFIPVALSGRVYVKVIGKVKLGSPIVPSNISGVGIMFKGISHTQNQILGYVVDDPVGGEKQRLVKILIK